MRRSLALALALALAGCGGKSGTISLALIPSPTDNPFTQATQVRFTVPTDTNGLCAQKMPTVDVENITNGGVNINFNEKPDANCIVPIIVELLDAGGSMIAWGQTPALQLGAFDQPGDGSAIRVFIGRPGRVLAALDSFKPERTEMATSYVTELGAVFFGGRSADGSVLNDVALYSVYGHSLVDNNTQIPFLAQKRADGVAIAASGYRALVFGGAQDPGVGARGTPLNTVELLDSGLASLSSPSVAAVSGGDMIDPRSAPNVSLVGNGSLLIAGGADAMGNPLATAAILSTDATPRLTAITPMQAARLGAACAPAKFPDSDGVFCFGGLAKGSTQPLAERLAGTTFGAYDVGMQKNRTGATATTLSDGRVLIAGGHDDSGQALASGFVIQPTTPAAMVTALPTLLSAPRDGHSATLLPKGDVLICGGGPPGMAPSSTCDLLDGKSLMAKDLVPLGYARRDHAAVMLETGEVLIAGGTGTDGKPLAALELYKTAR